MKYLVWPLMYEIVTILSWLNNENTCVRIVELIVRLRTPQLSFYIHTTRTPPQIAFI